MATPNGRLAAAPIVATFNERRMAVHSGGENGARSVLNPEPCSTPNASPPSTAERDSAAYILMNIARRRSAEQFLPRTAGEGHHAKHGGGPAAHQDSPNRRGPLHRATRGPPPPFRFAPRGRMVRPTPRGSRPPASSRPRRARSSPESTRR